MKNVVVLSGKMGAGKDTFCGCMRDILERERGVSVDQCAFADDLKKGAWDDLQPIFLAMREQCDKLMASGIPEETVSWMRTELDNLYTHKTPLSRAALQSYGDLFRKRVSATHWVDRCLASINGSEAEFVIVTDARRVNEVESIVAWGDAHPESRVLLVRVERPEVAPTGAASILLHDSEVALDDFESWGYVVSNSGTIQDLHDAARAVLDSLLEY